MRCYIEGKLRASTDWCRLSNWLSQLLKTAIQPLQVLMCPLLAAALVQTTIQATETVALQQLAPISLYANCQDVSTSWRRDSIIALLA